MAVRLVLWPTALMFDVEGKFAKGTAVFDYEVTFAYPTCELVPGIGFFIAEDVEMGIKVPRGLKNYTPHWQVTMQVEFCVLTMPTTYWLHVANVC